MEDPISDNTGPEAYPEVPTELKRWPHWVCWRYEPADPKPRKVPINPRTGCNAQTNNPQTWGTFEQAIVGSNKYSVMGVGFVFTTTDPFVGIDFDHCRDPETGAITPDVYCWLEQLDSYTEVSPSGTGVHVLVKGGLPKAAKRHGIELYDRGRYFTVTGNRIPDFKPTIERRGGNDGAIAALFRHVCPEFFEKPTTAAPPPMATPGASRPAMDDDEVISRASNCGPCATRFVRVFRMGHWQEYFPTPSEADFSMARHLAFWCGPDGQEQVHRLMWTSWLRRDKWREHRRGGTWLQETIARAYAACPSFYEPRTAA